jgi:hypothetical protein
MKSVCESGTAHVSMEIMIESADNLHRSDPLSLECLLCLAIATAFSEN